MLVAMELLMSVDRAGVGLLRGPVVEERKSNFLFYFIVSFYSTYFIVLFTQVFICADTDLQRNNVIM